MIWIISRILAVHVVLSPIDITLNFDLFKALFPLLENDVGSCKKLVIPGISYHRVQDSIIQYKSMK